MNASAGDSNDQYLFYHTYAMAVWAFFLDEKVGGQELVERSWSRSSLRSGQYNYWMPDVVDDLDKDWDELYQEFMATNATMDYAEANFFDDPELTDTVSNLPDSGEDRSSDRPQSLGQNFIRFKGSAGEAGGTLRVTFDGENGVDWYAVLARGSDELLEYVTFDLDSSGEGVAEIALDGDEDVFLVVSPMDEDAQGYNYNWNYADDYSYDWEAELISGSDDDDDDGEDDGGADGGTDLGGDGADESGEEFSVFGACGCSAGTVGGGLTMAWVMGLFGLIRRRSAEE